MGRMGLLRISDADAVVGEVLSPKTFYAVAPPRKTGVMATVAIIAGSNAYPAGYHVGDGAGLSNVDTDLVTANIKDSITIFNVLGDPDVRDISDADLVEAEAPTGKFFYAVSGGRRTGSGTQALNPANETVAAGYYAATTLSAVDGDLAVGNIVSGINIFGFAGTVVLESYNKTEMKEALGGSAGGYCGGDAGWYESSTSYQDALAHTIKVLAGGGTLVAAIGGRFCSDNSGQSVAVESTLDTVQKDEQTTTSTAAVTYNLGFSSAVAAGNRVISLNMKRIGTGGCRINPTTADIV